MKRKAYLAVLAMSVMCLTASAAGCGNKETTESTKETQEESEASGSEEKKSEDSKEDEKEDSEDSEEQENTEYKPSRLVSVDNVEKYITIGQYKELSLENAVTDITDEDVDIEIDERLQGYAEEVSEGSVEEGDIATISYVGTVDGVEFEGGSDENYDLTIGSGTFIEGFEEGIIGMKTGETKDLNLTFAENYFSGCDSSACHCGRTGHAGPRTFPALGGFHVVSAQSSSGKIFR